MATSAPVRVPDRFKRVLPAPVKSFSSRRVLNAIDPLVVRRYRNRSDYAGILPPRQIRLRSGAAGPDAWVGGGRRVADELHRLLAMAGRGLESFGSILDFGCGAGRVLAALGPNDGQRRAGCDVDVGAITWAQAHLSDVDLRPNRFNPPTPWAAGSFDLVFSISIFTHLSQPATARWLAEISRLLAPDGLGILTIHGPGLYNTYRDGRRPATAAQVAALRREGPLRTDAVIFAPEAMSRWERWRFPGVGPDYGLTFTGHEYVRTVWSRAVTILEIVPESINWRQDAVLVAPLAPT